MILKGTFRLVQKEDISLTKITNFLDNKPIIVNIVPKFGCKENQCHFNVDMYIKNYGGKKIVGYYLVTDVLDVNRTYAIKHSILYHKKEYLDITPFNDNRKYNIFIASNKVNFKHIEFYKNKIKSIGININI